MRRWRSKFSYPWSAVSVWKVSYEVYPFLVIIGDYTCSHSKICIYTLQDLVGVLGFGERSLSLSRLPDEDGAVDGHHKADRIFHKIL